MNSVLDVVSFPVETRRVFYRGPEDFVEVPDKRAVVRTDTGEALSVVSDQYKLVPYQHVVEPLLEAIDKNGGSLVSRAFGRRAEPVRVEGNGRRVWLEASFGQPIFIGQDEIRPRIVYGNSYDTTAAVRMITGFYQVKCTNAGALLQPGRAKGFGGGQFYAQHSGKYELELGQISDSIKDFLENFHEKADSLRVMLNMSLSPETMKEIAEEMIGQRNLAKKPLAPKDTENAWSFYARITNHLTMDFKGGQQPSEARASKALAQILKEMR